MDENQVFTEEIQDENSFLNIDFKKLIADILNYWWVFVAAVAVALTATTLYSHYTTPIFSCSSKMIVDEQGAANSSMNSQQSLIDGFVLSPGMRNIDNQIAVLGSRTMIGRVVDRMGIYISYYNIGRVRDVEMYPNRSFELVIDSTHAQLLGTRINISVVDSSRFVLKVKTENGSLYNYAERQRVGNIKELDYEKIHFFGEPIVTPWCAFSVVKYNYWLDGDFYAVFNDPMQLAIGFAGSLRIVRDAETNSSVVTLIINGSSTAKCCDFLNTLADEFINENLRRKNLMAENTIEFIEGQLGLLSDTLVDIGTQLSSFRATHGIQQTVSEKGQAIFKELQDYEKELQEQQIILSYYGYLEKYFATDSVLSGVIAPAVYDTKSQVIADQLSQIMTLNAEKQAYQDTYGKSNNPASREVMAKLHIARNTLLKSISNHKKMTEDRMTEIQNELEIRASEMNSLPETERQLLGIDRRFTLNNEVYTYLLRKRSESQIQKASNTSDHKILDSAIVGSQISPNTKRNRMTALTIAIILPLVFFLLRQILDNRLRTTDDLKRITKNPILAEVPSSTKGTPLVVAKYPRSILAETFRRMRTRIDFMIAGKEKPIIMVSSAMSGDGKTFCAINTAIVYAMSGKKTAILGFDLRKPDLSKLMNCNDHLGLSNYLIGSCTYDEIIVPCSDVPNLDVFPAGAIPPNPAELITTKQCDELMEILKKNYDIIIVDTPPMGLVSDAYQLTKWSDTLLFVVRQDHTYKDIFKEIVTNFSDEGIKSVGILFNDMNNQKSRYGYGYGKYGKYGRYGGGKKYGYGYGKYGKYGYGYGYGSEAGHGYYVEE